MALSYVDTLVCVYVYDCIFIYYIQNHQIHRHTHVHTQTPHILLPHHPIHLDFIYYLCCWMWNKISTDKLTHPCSLDFVLFATLCTFPEWEHKQKSRWEFFLWYFHCFLCETHKPYAIMGIGAGIWGACQVLGVLWCVLFSARVAIADNSKYNSAGPDVKFWTPQWI